MADKAERFELRVEKQMLECIDEWRSNQIDLPSRAEAMRRLATLGLVERNGQQLFQSTRFNLLAAALNAATKPLLDDSYVYAWSAGVYPWLHDCKGRVLHKPFDKYFEFSQSMGTDLSRKLNQAQDATPSYWVLEAQYGKQSLGRALRYMYLDGQLDNEMWSAFIAKNQPPMEIHQISWPFDRKSINLA
jgi:hypothetical protein